MTRTQLKTGGLYVAFAVVAAVANLGSQWVLLTGGAGLGFTRALLLLPALVLGTGIGLVIKYGLDKVYIFEDRSKGVGVHARKFTLYSVMGLLTTAIFWGTEYLFARLDPDGSLLYLGGAIGLAIGYMVKYQLDRRFVFETAADTP